ncbi:MAG: hypothetical protein [Microvirus sp.]|nr:MAG: hypothetical protein [Microvirus sp.]
MIRSMIASFLRHIVTVYAGMGISVGMMENQITDTWPSIMLAAVALIWSFLDKTNTPRPIVHYNYRTPFPSPSERK